MDRARENAVRAVVWVTGGNLPGKGFRAETSPDDLKPTPDRRILGVVPTQRVGRNLAAGVVVGQQHDALLSPGALAGEDSPSPAVAVVAVRGGHRTPTATPIAYIIPT